MDRVPPFPVICSLAVLAAMATSSFAAPVVLDFEGAGNGAQLLQFYNGGTDSQGNSGANVGISFGSTAQALVDSDAGGTFSFANEPSPSTVLSFLHSTSGVINYAGGFMTGFSFSYSAVRPVTVTLYDGLNATGGVLGTLTLPAQALNDGCIGDPTGSFCNWTAASTGFGGTARSIGFAVAQGAAMFDNFSFDSPATGQEENQIPLPGTLLLSAPALTGLAWVRRRHGMVAGSLPEHQGRRSRT